MVSIEYCLIQVPNCPVPRCPGQYRNVQYRVPRCPSQYRNVQVPRCLGFNYRYDVKFVGFLDSEENFVKNADRLKKGILAETKHAHQLKGKCIFIDLDMGFPEQVA